MDEVMTKADAKPVFWKLRYKDNSEQEAFIASKLDEDGTTKKAEAELTLMCGPDAYEIVELRPMTADERLELEQMITARLPEGMTIEEALTPSEPTPTLN